MSKKNLDRINMESINFKGEYPSITFGRKHTLKLYFKQGITEKQLVLFKKILNNVDALNFTFEIKKALSELTKDEIMDLDSISLEETCMDENKEWIRHLCHFTLFIKALNDNDCLVKVGEPFYEIMNKHFYLTRG